MTTKKTAVKKVVAKKSVTKPAAKPAAKKTTKAAPTKTTAKKAAPKTSKTTTVKTPAKASAKKPAVKTVAKTAAKKTPAKKTAAKTPTKTTTKSNPVMEAIKGMARAVEKALDMNKAKDIVAVDLTRKSALADFMIVASGNNSRQVAALARYAEEALLKAGSKRCKIEGLPQGDWVIVDSGDIIVHLFRPEVREFYQIERLWTDEPGEANTRRSLA